MCACVCACGKEKKCVHAAEDAGSAEEKKTIRRKKRDKEKLSSGKIEFEKLVANAETSTVLHRQAQEAAQCSAEAEVDSSNNGEWTLCIIGSHVF